MLDEIIFTQLVVDECECDISYYRGDSYVTVKNFETFVTQGRVTKDYLLKVIYNMRLKKLKEDMCV